MKAVQQGQDRMRLGFENPLWGCVKNGLEGASTGVGRPERRLLLNSRREKTVTGTQVV